MIKYLKYHIGQLTIDLYMMFLPFMPLVCIGITEIAPIHESVRDSLPEVDLGSVAGGVHRFRSSLMNNHFL